jgi:tellurium resistance protein TerD
MCKRKASTKRRGRTPEEKAVTADPVADRTTNIPEMPVDHMIPGKDGKPVAAISPDEAMVMPTTGKAALKRVFLGLGWAQRASDGNIDVDCCCAPYAKGVRGDEDIVWYGKLRSSLEADGKFCTIKHSGDVLTGQAGGELEDLERIYVDLENLDDKYDCLAFEGNIYTSGLNFASLSTAYIRLVNADTNQEIARCSIGDGTSMDLNTMQSRVLLFAKLFRGKDRWVLHTVSEPRKTELKNDPSGVVNSEMIMIEADDGAPKKQEMDRAAEPTLDGTLAIEAEAEPEAASLDGHAGGKKKAKRSYLVPAVAVGTAAGIAAAVALFGPDPLEMGSMASGVFSDGVDWATMVAPDVSFFSVLFSHKTHAPFLSLSAPIMNRRPPLTLFHTAKKRIASTTFQIGRHRLLRLPQQLRVPWRLQRR